MITPLLRVHDPRHDAGHVPVEAATAEVLATCGGTATICVALCGRGAEKELLLLLLWLERLSETTDNHNGSRHAEQRSTIVWTFDDVFLRLVASYVWLLIARCSY